MFVNGALEDFDVPCVSVDERHAGYVATQHLISLGHRRIGFVAGPADYLPTREKAAGRAEALFEEGLEPDGLVAHGDFTLEGGRRGARDAEPQRPTDRRDLLERRDRDRRHPGGAPTRPAHPEDISVVGFDGIEAASWVDPPLTTIEQPIDEIATTAIELLQTVIAEPRRSVPRMLYQPRLRSGGTTGAPPAR